MTEATSARSKADRQTNSSIKKVADVVGVKDDPVSGWLIAGGVGVVAGGWAIATSATADIGLIAAGAAAQSHYGLAG